MYVHDMTLSEAKDWLAYLDEILPATGATTEQHKWDVEDLKEHIAELEAKQRRAIPMCPIGLGRK